MALSISTDWLLFEDDERGPDDALKLQFEAVRQFDAEDRKTALEVFEGLILKHQAKRMLMRAQGAPACERAAKQTAAKTQIKTPPAGGVGGGLSLI